MPPRQRDRQEGPSEEVQRDVASLWEVDVTAALTSGIVRARPALVKNRPNDEIVRRLAELRKQAARVAERRHPAGRRDPGRPRARPLAPDARLVHVGVQQPAVGEEVGADQGWNAVQWLSVILAHRPQLDAALVRDVQVRRLRTGAIRRATTSAAQTRSAGAAVRRLRRVVAAILRTSVGQPGHFALAASSRCRSARRRLPAAASTKLAPSPTRRSTSAWSRRRSRYWAAPRRS